MISEDTEEPRPKKICVEAVDAFGLYIVEDSTSDS
jgi:hypothetical protein